jgi:hypothetical protein
LCGVVGDDMDRGIMHNATVLATALEWVIGESTEKSEAFAELLKDLREEELAFNADRN